MTTPNNLNKPKSRGRPATGDGVDRFSICMKKEIAEVVDAHVSRTGLSRSEVITALVVEAMMTGKIQK